MFFVIRILILHPSRIPDPGVKKAPDPGSGSATLAELEFGIALNTYQLQVRAKFFVLLN
jgi:hypothetical protein